MKSISNAINIRVRVYRNCPHCGAELKWWQMMDKIFFCSQCKQKSFRNTSNRRAYAFFLLMLILEFTLLIYAAYTAKNDLFKEPFWFYTPLFVLCLIYCLMMVVIVMTTPLQTHSSGMSLGATFTWVILFFLATYFMPKLVIFVL